MTKMQRSSRTSELISAPWWPTSSNVYQVLRKAWKDCLISPVTNNAVQVRMINYWIHFLYMSNTILLSSSSICDCKLYSRLPFSCVSTAHGAQDSWHWSWFGRSPRGAAKIVQLKDIAGKYRWWLMGCEAFTSPHWMANDLSGDINTLLSYRKMRFFVLVKSFRYLNTFADSSLSQWADQ